MVEIIHSVGIDIGTSTTQLIFSKITIENRASSYSVPRIDIVDKEVVYRSDIYFTPLKSPTEIDAKAVKDIVISEYKKAGKKPTDLNTGAVIITGETARKENANEVLEALSSMAGDFVVATAGPDLESVLSAKGAGADVISKECKAAVANLDIGGGTTNIAIYANGVMMGVCCLDIGGRLIKIENGKISYIFHKIEKLARTHGINITQGENADIQKLSKVCDLMADHLAQAIHAKSYDTQHSNLYTNEGKNLVSEPQIKAITFSGGVADCIYENQSGDVFKFGDIGILLGEAIKKHSAFKQIKTYKATETIRATVVGAGTHTTEVSGSTITYDKEKLPVKNIPILKIPQEEDYSIDSIKSSISRQLPMFFSSSKPEQIALALSGNQYKGFAQIQQLAQAIIQAMQTIINSEYPLIVVVESDIGKALGHALKINLSNRKEIICIDAIATSSGDYIDIGLPIAEGKVLPVVIKTLIFNS